MRSKLKIIIYTIIFGFIILVLSGLGILTKNVFDDNCNMTKENLIVSQISLITFWALIIGLILYILIDVFTSI
jgi:hypothetical protein